MAYHCFETMAVMGGEVLGLDWHIQRFSWTVEAHGGKGKKLSLAVHGFEEQARSLGADWNKEEQGRLRIDYSSDGEGQVYFESNGVELYFRPKAAGLVLINDPSLDYPYKYADRRTLDRWDPILPPGHLPLFTQGPWLAEGQFTNVVVEEPTGALVTPAHCVLPGTMRAQLVHRGIVQVRPLNWAAVFEAERIHLINALNPLGCLVFKPTQILFHQEKYP